MATSLRERNLAALQNPNVRAALDVIAAAEGVRHGYNTAFGNTRIASLQDHPRTSKSFRQTDGGRNTTTAAGRYQFLASTWDAVAKANDSKTFTPLEQDLGAVQLLREAGALPTIEQGNVLEGLNRPRVGNIWASLPSAPDKYRQKRRSADFLQNAVASAISAPSGIPETRPEKSTPTANIKDMVSSLLASDALLQPSQVASPAPVAEIPSSIPPELPLSAMGQVALQQRSMEDWNRLASIPSESEEFTPEEQAILNSAFDDEANIARLNAQAAFFDEQPVSRVLLPNAIEQSISRFLTEL